MKDQFIYFLAFEVQMPTANLDLSNSLYYFLKSGSCLYVGLQTYIAKMSLFEDSD